MIKDKTITGEQIRWFIDNCIGNNEEGFEHLCDTCPIKAECYEEWGRE